MYNKHYTRTKKWLSVVQFQTTIFLFLLQDVKFWSGCQNTSHFRCTINCARGIASSTTLLWTVSKWHRFCHLCCHRRTCPSLNPSMSQVTKTHVESFTISKKQAAAPKNTCNKIAKKKSCKRPMDKAPGSWHEIWWHSSYIYLPTDRASFRNLTFVQNALPISIRVNESMPQLQITFGAGYL